MYFVVGDGLADHAVPLTVQCSSAQCYAWKGLNGNGTNCLIKSQFEKDTLPHLKIYSKLPGRKQGNRRVLHEGMEGTVSLTMAEA